MSDLSHTPMLPRIASSRTFTPRRQAHFCDSLAQHGNVRVAAYIAGVSPQTAYRARRASAGLSTCWDAALLLARTHAEQVLAERALDGVEETVFFRGEEIGTRRRYDSRLLLAHLARLDAKAAAVAARDVPGAARTAEARFDAMLARLARLDAPLESYDEDYEDDDDDCDGPAPVDDNTAAADDAADDAAGEDPENDLYEDDDDDATDPGFAYDPAGFGVAGEEWGTYVAPFERRLRAMYAARPADAPGCHEQGDDADEVEAVQMLAFERGLPEWWTLTTLPPTTLPQRADISSQDRVPGVPQSPPSDWLDTEFDNLAETRSALQAATLSDTACTPVPPHHELR